MTFSKVPSPEQGKFFVRKGGLRLNDPQLFVLLGRFCDNPSPRRGSRIRAGHGGHSRTGTGPRTSPCLPQGNSFASFHREVVGPVDRVGSGGIGTAVRVLGSPLVRPGGRRLFRA